MPPKPDAVSRTACLQLSRGPAVALLCLLASACGAAREDAIEAAMAGMRDQVAADIELTVDPETATAHYHDDEHLRYAVCGKATLHRPSDTPEMHLDHSRQRYVAKVYRNGAVLTEFEADPPRPEFAEVWSTHCR